VDLSNGNTIPFLTRTALLVLDKGTPSRYEAVAYSVADGSGNFDLTDIPPGQYTLVMKSSNAIGSLTPALVTTDTKGKPFKKPHVDEKAAPRDAAGRITFQRITVEAGKSLDESHDFGMSSFLEDPRLILMYQQLDQQSDTPK
jgi:hypothetical protein